jgi:dihydroorotate dehydrogenase (NAD+) catalytic subunit
LAMTNSVAALVEQSDGQLMFNGERRGICGEATFEASVSQVELFARLIAKRGDNLKVIGVGGAGSARHVKDYLGAGAEGVQIATAAMVEPLVGLKIRREWNAGSSDALNP